MSWERYRITMEQHAIKTDDMATEDAYFMATHIPFVQLEVIEGGEKEADPDLASEEEVFQHLVCNPDNIHRLVIVRGNNGTGKSHLIRYFKARFENSPPHVYDPQREQLIFLRRLNNSVRGAFSQLLEQDVIRNPEVQEKLRRFVESSESKDEQSFKTEILYAFIAAVMNDRSGETYKPVFCRNLAQYLSDSRVQDHLLREGGAISRCHRIITTPSDRVLDVSTVFTEKDFSDRKVNKQIIQTGNPEAQDWAYTMQDEGEIVRLVHYLNRFTGYVVQQCADISSESTKTVFEQLRRDLKEQGKNLTLFIEDFTGFTGIDAELITVISTEHGGDYADLCRVTAIIGITDGYYGQFKDNFKDRVTHQINVSERAYGSDEFLQQMTARYLNAIYCDPDAIHAWYAQGAKEELLPIGRFSPPCRLWESVPLGDKELTLYPFNRNAIHRLYQELKFKTPRMFLRNVIRDQLKAYFDGKQRGAPWAFPRRVGNVQMANGPHSSVIDRLESLPPQDRQRLKTALACWGDGSAAATRRDDGIPLLGGVDQAFFADIGLDSFDGVGGARKEDGGARQTPVDERKTIAPKPEPPELEIPTPDPAHQRRVKEYAMYRNDIDAWFSDGTALQYHPNYREWIRRFLCGFANNPGAINWQDCGIPAYIAHERFQDLSVIYIQGQDEGPPLAKAIFVVEKTPESRDALRALTELHNAGSWNFEGAVFYQQRLITWLERNKEGVTERTFPSVGPDGRLPLAKWCLTLQYLKAMIYGRRVDTSSPLAAVTALLKPVAPTENNPRITKEWDDLILFVKNEEPNFAGAFDLLKKSSGTVMGAISHAKNPKTPIYHAAELLTAARELIDCNWDIRDLLPDAPENNLLFAPAALLNRLYPRLGKLVAAERAQIAHYRAKIAEQVGELNQENLIKTIHAVQQLFAAFQRNSVIGEAELRGRYEDAVPMDVARKLLRILDKLEGPAPDDVMADLTVYAQNDSRRLKEFHDDLQEIERKALQEQDKADRECRELAGGESLDQAAAKSVTVLAGICDRLEKMEVRHAD